MLHPLPGHNSPAALAEQGIDRFDLVGHSMGGLTSLVLAHQHPERMEHLPGLSR